MTQPKPELQMSDNAIIKMRNGLLLFQVRFISPHGHYFTDMSVKMVSFMRMQSLEGESYMQIKELTTDCCHRGGNMPVNANHYITRDSALYGIDFSDFGGWVEVILTGYDEFLGARVTSCQLYGAHNINVGYDYDSCFITGMTDAVKGNKAVEVDMNRFHRVSPCDRKWQEVIDKALAAAKEQRDSRKALCQEVGHEARYYTAPGTCSGPNYV